MDSDLEDFDFVVEDSKAIIHFEANLELSSKEKVALREEEKEIPSQPIASHLMSPHPKGPEVPEFPRPAVPKFQRPEVPIFPRPAVPSCQDCANQSVINPFLSLRKNLC